MITIQGFARLCGCNTQTLRYYDRIGLLTPARVDTWTGYRYYEESQALQFVKIKNLQQADFSIDEIRPLLEADGACLQEAFARKIARQDRLTGNAVYCYEHGREPKALMRSMANVFAYDEPRDPKAVEIQDYIREHGIEEAVPRYTGLPANHHIVQTVIENYKKLTK